MIDSCRIIAQLPYSLNKQSNFTLNTKHRMKKSFCILLLLSCVHIVWGQSIFEKNGKFGLKNEDGTMLLKADYLQIIPISGTYYLFCQQAPSYRGTGVAKHDVPENGIPATDLYSECGKNMPFQFDPNLRYGLYYDDQVVLAAQYQEIHFAMNEDAIIVKQEGEFYAYDKAKNKLNKKTKSSSLCAVPGEGEGSFIFRKNGKYGVFDQNFKAVVKPMYDRIELLSSNTQNSIYALYSGDGMVLADPAIWHFLITKNIQEIEIDTVRGEAVIVRNGSYGLIEIYEGNEIIPTKYEAVERLSFGDWIVLKKNGKYGIGVEYEEAISLPFEYEAIEILDDKNKLIKAKKIGKWQILQEQDYKFTAVDGREYEQISPLAGNEAFYKIEENGKIGFIQKEGFNEIHAPQFTSVKKVDVPVTFKEDDYFEVRKGEQIGLLDFNTLQEVLPAEYEAYEDISLTDTKVFLVKKGGKWGFEDTSKAGLEIPTEYDALKRSSSSKWLIATKNGKSGLILRDNSSLLAFDYTDIRVDATKTGALVYAKKDGLWGIMEIVNQSPKPTVTTIQEFQFEDVTPIEGEGLDGYVKMKKGGKFGLYKLYTDKFSKSWQEVLPPKYDDISYESKLTVRVKENGKLGSATLRSGNVLMLNSMSDVFPLKWTAAIGKSNFRTNLMFANGWLLVPSNGSKRGGLQDDKDGLYIIDPKTGKTIRQLRLGTTGNTDINGVAVSGDKVFFGNDNNQVACFTMEGDKVWEAAVEGDIEGSPTLFDSNGDGTDDAIFATEKGFLLAFDGKTGKLLWQYSAANKGYFTATPAAYDVNDDATPDVLIGTGGSPYFYAVDGKTGKELWQFKTKSTSGFVDGSAVHASATVVKEPGRKPLIMAAECYGIIHFLSKEGEWKAYIGNTIGIFSSPVVSPKGTIVNGASWLGSGNVDVTVIRGQADWEEQRGGVKYVNRRTQMDGSPVGVTSSSAFVADVLSKGAPQFGISDETGKFQLINEEGIVEEIALLPAGVEAPIFVHDIDGDGMLEIVVACLDGNVYCYDTTSTSKAYWGQFRGDNKNTGVLRK